MKTDVQKIINGFSAVAEAVYGPGYRHPPESHVFFDSMLRTALSQIDAPSPVRVLEIGCGNGYWLRVVTQVASAMGLDVNVHGADVTPALVNLAREALKDILPASALFVGDLLKGDVSGRYHLCYAYDVVQQIDRRDHGLLLSNVRSLLEEGGLFIIFDRDPLSRYGIGMALRKAFTRHLRLRLVPDFYLLAHYPSFRRLVHLARRAGFEVVSDLCGASRRALVLRPSPSSVTTKVPSVKCQAPSAE